MMAAASRLSPVLCVFLFLALSISQPLHLVQKTLHELDVQATHKPTVLNDDAPAAVARVIAPPDMDDALEVNLEGQELASLTNENKTTHITANAGLKPSLYGTLHLGPESTFDTLGLKMHLSTILSAACLSAYALLLAKTSRSHKYIMETIQLLACMCFPTLPLIQLLHNSLKTSTALLTNPSHRHTSLSYWLHCLAGQYPFQPETHRAELFEPRRRLVESSSHEIEYHRRPRLTLRWLAKLAVLLTLLAASAHALQLYRAQPTRSEWDAAAIGHDNRAGWLALGGAVSATLTLLTHLAPSHWAVRAQYAPAEPSGLLWESEVFTELALAALLQDAAAAAAGAVSLLGLLLVFMANRLALVLIFVALALCNRLLYSGGDGLFAARHRYRNVRPLAVAFSVGICSCIVAFQICTAILEQTEAGGEPWVVAARPSSSQHVFML